MENDCTVNIVSLEKDRDVSEASAESQSESTLSNSLDSGVTAETSRSDADSKLVSYQIFLSQFVYFPCLV